jgi:hypothetical protein
MFSECLTSPDRATIFPAIVSVVSSEFDSQEIRVVKLFFELLCHSWKDKTSHIETFRSPVLNSLMKLIRQL